MRFERWYVALAAATVAAGVLLVASVVETVTRDDRLANAQILTTPASAEWAAERSRLRTWAVAAGVVNVGLLVLIAWLVARELRRRSRRAGELEALVQERTGELSELSSHLQRVAENERSRLARELHDELGGLLVAVKMDLAQLERELPLDQPAFRARWQRIQSALTEGVALKRRVIEELRPTLLDTMGLVSALRWQFQEACTRAGLQCSDSLPEDELEFEPDVAIALFRIAQEAMTNIARHAEASTAEVRLSVEGDQLVMVIRDDGRGIGPSSEPAIRSPGTGWGLATMRHRARGVGGDIRVGPGERGGTEIRVTVPRARALRPAEALS